MSKLEEALREIAVKDAGLDVARNAKGNTLLVLVSPRQAERLYLALQIADGVLEAEELGHDTGIKHRVWKRYGELTVKGNIEKGTASPGGPAERDPDTGTIEQGPHVTRRHARSGDIAVLRVDQSPLNKLQWCLALSCGHDVWVTSKKRPARRTVKCPTCAR